MLSNEENSPLLAALQRLAAAEPDVGTTRSANWQERVLALRELRAAVGRIVCERRAEGVPVERVIIELKAMLNAAARESPLDFQVEPVREKVVQWCSAAYFAPHGDDETPSGAADADPGDSAATGR